MWPARPMQRSPPLSGSHCDYQAYVFSKNLLNCVGLAPQCLEDFGQSEWVAAFVLTELSVWVMGDGVIISGCPLAFCLHPLLSSPRVLLCIPPNLPWVLAYYWRPSLLMGMLLCYTTHKDTQLLELDWYSGPFAFADRLFCIFIKAWTCNTVAVINLFHHMLISFYRASNLMWTKLVGK